MVALPKLASPPVVLTAASTDTPATPSVPVLLVFWKKAAAAVLLRIPELERYAFVPPVRRTLEATVATPATPRVPVLLVF
jgi:hypothetical protein